MLLSPEDELTAGEGEPGKEDGGDVRAAGRKHKGKTGVTSGTVTYSNAWK